MVEAGAVTLQYVETADNLADPFTKSVSRQAIERPFVVCASFEFASQSLPRRLVVLFHWNYGYIWLWNVRLGAPVELEWFRWPKCCSYATEVAGRA